MGGTFRFEGALDFGSAKKSERARASLPPPLGEGARIDGSRLHLATILATTPLHALEIAEALGRVAKAAVGGHYDLTDLEAGVLVRGRPGIEPIGIAPDLPPAQGRIVHPEPIYTAVATGDLVAVAGRDAARTKYSRPDDVGVGATVTVWNRKTRSLLARLGESAHTPSIAFAPDGARLAVRSWGAGVSLWDVSTGGRVGGAKESASSLVWSPDGQRLAGWVSLSRRGRLVVFDTATCKVSFRADNLSPEQWLGSVELLVRRVQLGSPVYVVVNVVTGEETHPHVWGATRGVPARGDWEVRNEPTVTLGRYAWSLFATSAPRSLVASTPSGVFKGLLSPLPCPRGGFLVADGATLSWIGPGAAPREVVTLGPEVKVHAVTEDGALLCSEEGSPNLDEIQLSLP
jgi:hypothetical protein